MSEFPRKRTVAENLADIDKHTSESHDIAAFREIAWRDGDSNEWDEKMSFHHQLTELHLAICRIHDVLLEQFAQEIER